MSALALAACDSRASSAARGPGDASIGGEPAVMVVGQVYSPEGYNTYVGVFPEVPRGELSFETFREFGNANAYTHGGYVFVEEEGTMKRFSVSDELELIDGPEFSWLDFGIASTNASYTVFVDARRAYTFAAELGVVVVAS